MAEARSTLQDNAAGINRPTVEIYRPVAEYHQHAYRVVAIAADDSPEALRAAQALALEVEQELADELAARKAARADRKRKPRDAK